VTVLFRGRLFRRQFWQSVEDFSCAHGQNLPSPLKAFKPRASHPPNSTLEIKTSSPKCCAGSVLFTEPTTSGQIWRAGGSRAPRNDCSLPEVIKDSESNLDKVLVSFIKCESKQNHRQPIIACWCSRLTAGGSIFGPSITVIDDDLRP